MADFARGFAFATPNRRQEAANRNVVQATTRHRARGPDRVRVHDLCPYLREGMIGDQHTPRRQPTQPVSDKAQTEVVRHRSLDQDSA